MGKIKIDSADKYFSLWIRNRDNWTCQRCLKKYNPPTTALHCSHFKGRSKENTRFDELNCDSLCMGCHLYFTSQPDEHYLWQINKKGKQVVDELILKSNQYKKKDRKAESKYWKTRLKEDFGL